MESGGRRFKSALRNQTRRSSQFCEDLFYKIERDAERQLAKILCPKMLLSDENLWYNTKYY